VGNSPQATKPQKNTGDKHREPDSGLIEYWQENLEKYGYAANPYCEKCRGLGMLHPISINGMTQWDKTIMCSEKGCLKESFEARQRGDATLALTGIAQAKVQTFDNFKLVKGVRETYYAFKKLADAEADCMMLLVYGGVGNGKTHLCHALVRRLHADGIPVLYYAAQDMYADLRKGIESNTIEQTVDKLKNIDALVIDDFKVLEKSTNWEVPKLEEIIDYRYRNIALTVLVSNQDLDAIPERIVSRFDEPGIGKLVLNKAGDFRRQR
jgi:DNA replication protein DnaC